MREQSSQNAEYQQRLLKNLEEEPPTSVKMEYPPSLGGSTLQALYNSQTPNSLGFSEGALLREVVGAQSVGRSRDADDDDEEREDEEEVQAGSAMQPRDGSYHHMIKADPGALPFDQSGFPQPPHGAHFIPNHSAPATTTTAVAQPTKPAPRKGRGRAAKQQPGQPNSSTPSAQQSQQQSQQQQQFHQQMMQQMQRTTPTLMIGQIANVEKNTDNQLKAMRFTQRRVIDNFHNREEVEKLIKAHADLRKQVRICLSRIESILTCNKNRSILQ